MTEAQIKLLIAQGEGYNLEMKQSLPSKASDLAEELCAFANAAGGTVLIGVDDKNNVIGVTMDNLAKSRLQNIMNAVVPSLEIRQNEIIVDGKNVLCLEIPSGKKKPYTVSGTIVIRNGPNSEKILSPDKMRDFFQQSDRIFFDEITCKQFEYPKDWDDKLFDQFRQLAGISSALPTDILLQNLQLKTEEGLFKSGAVLFFGNNPQVFYPQAETRCLLFKGADKTNIFDDKVYRGSLYNQYTEAINFLRQKLNLRYRIESAGPRIEELEIPEVVLREAVVNALCHRDYFEKGATIMIEIFDNRVVISNPGGLVSSIDRHEFGQRSLSRNPLIFGLFQRMQLVEKVGSGISRMRTVMNSVDLPDPSFQLEGMFTIGLNRPVDFSVWLESVKSKLRPLMINILILLTDSPSVTSREMADLLGVTTRTIERNINGLRGAGILERVGGDKSGYYKIHQVNL